MIPQDVVDFLNREVRNGILEIFKDGKRYIVSVGANEESIFDIASITKIFGAYFSMKKLNIYEKISEVLDVEKEKRNITIYHILHHNAGFQSFIPLWEKGEGEEIKRIALHSPLAYTPGERELYSDIGFIVLTYFIEKLFSKRISDVIKDFLNERNIEVYFLDDILERKIDFVKTSDYVRVHDENSYRMMGQSLHAGIFINLKNLRKIALNFRKEFEEVIEKFNEWRKNMKGRFILGFDTFVRGEKIFLGHLGYTGCAFWIDPERMDYAILLTNRVYPSVGRYPEKVPEKFIYFREKILEILM